MTLKNKNYLIIYFIYILCLLRRQIKPIKAQNSSDIKGTKLILLIRLMFTSLTLFVLLDQLFIVIIQQIKQSDETIASQGLMAECQI